MKRLFILVALGSSLLGCGTTPTQTATPSKSTNELRYEAYPKDTATLEALVNEQIALFDQLGENATQGLFEQIFVNLKTLVEQKPQDRELVYRFYRIGLLRGFVNQQYDLNYWQDFYQQHAFLALINIAPPIYMTYLMSEQQMEQDASQAKPILLQTVKDSHAFINGHLKLADMYYEESQLELSVYLLNRLAKAYPDNVEVLTNLNWNRLELVQNNVCQRNIDNALDATFEQAKNLTKLEPDNPSNHVLLGSVLREKGRFMLSSFSIKKAAQLAPENSTDYLEAEFWNRKLTGIEAQLTSKTPEQLDEHQMALVMLTHLAQGQWSELLDATQAYNSKDDLSLYSALYGAYSAKFLNQDEQFQALIRQSLLRQAPTAWQQSMFDFALGKIGEQQLLSIAQNRCDESEARFVIALEHGAKGNTERLYQEMNKIIGLSVNGYYEFALARNILKLKAL